MRVTVLQSGPYLYGTLGAATFGPRQTAIMNPCVHHSENPTKLRMHLYVTTLQFEARKIVTLKTHLCPVVVLSCGGLRLESALGTRWARGGCPSRSNTPTTVLQQRGMHTSFQRVTTQADIQSGGRCGRSSDRHETVAFHGISCIVRPAGVRT